MTEAPTVHSLFSGRFPGFSERPVQGSADLAERSCMESKSWQRIASILQMCALSAVLTGLMLVVGSAPATPHDEDRVEKATARPLPEVHAAPEQHFEQLQIDPETLFRPAPPAGR